MKKLTLVIAIVIFVLVPVGNIYGQTQNQSTEIISSAQNDIVVQGPGTSNNDLQLQAGGGDAHSGSNSVLIYDPTTNTYYPKSRRPNLGLISPQQLTPPFFNGDGKSYNRVVEIAGINCERTWLEVDDFRIVLKNINYKGPLEEIGAGLSRNEIKSLTHGKGFRIINSFRIKGARPEGKPLYTIMSIEVDPFGNVVRVVDVRSLERLGYVFVGTTNTEGTINQNFDQVSVCAAAQAWPLNVDIGIFNGVMKIISTGKTEGGALAVGHATPNISVAFVPAKTKVSAESEGKGTFVIEWYQYNPIRARKIAVPEKLLNAITYRMGDSQQQVQTPSLEGIMEQRPASFPDENLSKKVIVTKRNLETVDFLKQTGVNITP